MQDPLQWMTAWTRDPVARQLASALLAVAIVIALVRVLQRATTRYIVDPTSRYRARKAVGTLGYVAGLLLVASVFSDRLGRLTVVLGVAGAGVAFALQEVIASVAGWLALSFGGFYKVGDRVQLGGVRGDVIDITLLRTTLMEVGQWVAGELYNGRVVRVANSFVFKEPVVNYSGDFPFLWDELIATVRFDSDLVLMQRVLEEVGREVCSEYEREAAQIWRGLQNRYSLEAATTEPLVTLGFDANGVTFTLRYTVRYDMRRTTKDRLCRKILDAVASSQGRITLTAATLELYPKTPFDVRVTQPERGGTG